MTTLNLSDDFKKELKKEKMRLTVEPHDMAPLVFSLFKENKLVAKIPKYEIEENSHSTSKMMAYLRKRVKNG